MSMTIPDNIERRVATRFEDKIQVDIVLPNDCVIPVEICGISNKGLQFTCEGWLADEIEPQGIQKLATSHKPLIINANLPFDNISKNVVIHTYVIAVRRLAQDKFLIGLDFENIADDGAEILEEYIQQLSMESRTNTSQQAY